MATTVNITTASGTTAFTCGTIRLASHSAKPIIINGFTVAYQWTLSVQGELLNNSGTTAVMTDMAAFETLIGAMTAISFSDGASGTAHAIAVGDTLTGFTKEFSWQDSELHLATEAKFALSLTYIKANLYESATLLETSETITVQGEGGAATPLVPQARSQWVYQQTMQYTPVYVTQSGYVIYSGTNTVTLPTYKVTTTNARQRPATQTSVSYMYEKQWIKATKVQYSWTYHLASHPGLILPSTF